jgi:F420-0:gamma-glutamyl ligase
MNVTPIKTALIEPGISVERILSTYIKTLEERSVIVIASKLFSYEERRFIKKTTDDKNEKWELAKKEADWWLDPNESKYQCMLTIKGSWMFANAGIDESNALGNQYAFWPKDPQASLNRVWNFVWKTYGVKEVGLLMSDSISFPLNWGVVGHAIAHCGFLALNSYIGTKDLYDRPMQMEQTNVAQSLVTVGTFVMGEGAERTPIAMITEIPHITFQDRVPSQEELHALKIDMRDDIFAPLLNRAPWNKGGSGIV